MSVDFARVAAAALAQAERLCAEWLGGKRQGHEWVGERRANGGLGDSWSVNLETGAFAHFGGDEKGGDLISLYAALNHVDQGTAARAVGELVGESNGVAGPVRAPPSEQACEPLPATDPPPHPKHGEPAAIYRYGDAFVIGRYDTADGKTFAQWTYRNDRWTLKSYPAPRPLFNAQAIQDKPTAPVLIAEGEKCAQAASAVLVTYACVSWAGGANAVKTADWSALARRNAIIWPDADEPGIKAALTLAEILLPICERVRVIRPDDHTDGWDVADAIADGWDYARIIEWARTHIQDIKKPESVAPKIGRLHDNKAPIEHESEAPETEPETRITQPESAVMSWQSLGLQCNSGGIPHPMEANVVAALSQHPRTRDKIWFDTFRQEVYHTLNGAERAWTDQDSRDCVYWLQKELQLVKFSKRIVDEGVLMYASMRARNSVQEFIEAEPWDGINRREHWLSDFLGCPNDPHHRAAGSNWLISMIARAYNPGCQVDHMLILEGEQRKGKSSVLRALAYPWYVTLTQRFGSKEFLESIQGNWLVELADLTALAGAGHAHILASITNRSDRYRAPWDRLASAHDRRCVFAGSTEKHNDYLADTYGIGRFWSIRCDGDINVDAVTAIRQQLFAEALAQFRAGEPFHLMPEQTRAEQTSRVESDPYLERVHSYLSGKAETTALEVFEAIFIQRDDFGRMIGRSIMEDKDGKRIAKILRLIGWYSIAAKREGRKVNLWQPLIGEMTTGTGTRT